MPPSHSMSPCRLARPAEAATGKEPPPLLSPSSRCSWARAISTLWIVRLLSLKHHTKSTQATRRRRDTGSSSSSEAPCSSRSSNLSLATVGATGGGWAVHSNGVRRVPPSTGMRVHVRGARAGGQVVVQAGAHVRARARCFCAVCVSVRGACSCARQFAIVFL